MALLLTLRAGGAALVSTGNLNTTQPDAVEILRAEGITVIGGPTKDSERARPRITARQLRDRCALPALLPDRPGNDQPPETPR